MRLTAQVTIASGTTADFQSPGAQFCPVGFEFPASIASTSFSLHVRRADGSTYALAYDSTNTALLSAVTITADRQYRIPAATSALLRGDTIRVVMGASETAKTISVIWNEYV